VSRMEDQGRMAHRLAPKGPITLRGLDRPNQHVSSCGLPSSTSHHSVRSPVRCPPFATDVNWFVSESSRTSLVAPRADAEPVVSTLLHALSCPIGEPAS